MTTITARELMTREVLTVSEDMPVTDLAAFFAENEITGAAVTNAREKLIGVVSLGDIAARVGESSDIVRSEFDPDFYVRGWEEIYNREEIAGLHVEHVDLLVRDVMNPSLYTVSEDTPVSKVAEKMLQSRLHRVFVTRGEALKGIISTSDFLRLFVAVPMAAVTSLAGEDQAVRETETSGASVS